MKTFLKILAILVLIVTIGAAGVVLYTLETRVPSVQILSAERIPAAEDAERFSSLTGMMAEGTYNGRVFNTETDVSLETGVFCQTVLRLQNRCLLPMEWIEIRLEPEAGDILEYRDENPHVLGARSGGDLFLQFLTVDDRVPVERTVSVMYYLLGKQMETETRITWSE